MMLLTASRAALRTLPLSSMACPSAYSRSTSCRRAIASAARRLAWTESWLPVMAVTRNASNATQFCGSAMVNVPTGGRKK